MSPQELNEQIEAWLDGLLNESESRIFEERLQKDAALASEVALHQQMRRASRDTDMADFRKSIDAMIGAEEANIGVTSDVAVKKVGIRRMLMAAAAALALILAAFWFFQNRMPSGVELYAKAFQPPAAFHYHDSPDGALGQKRGSADTLTLRWNAINQAWNTHQPDQAIRLALDIAATDSIPENRRAAFYMAGVMSLSANRPDQALEYLQQAEGIALYSEDIPWYMALAHFKLALENSNHRPQAVAALNRVLEQPLQPQPRPTQAKQMLRLLE